MRTMKDSGIEWIGQIPRAWQVVRVKHLATQKDSLFLDGDWINSDVITTEGIRYLTSGNVGEGAYKEQGNGHISEDTFEKQNCLKAFPGDLMISRLNEPVGRCCIIPEGHPFYVVAVDNVILRPDDGYNKKFIMYCMNTQGYAHAALMAASGTTMIRISRTSLGNLTIPVASVEEQKRIVEYLDTKCAEIDALIAAKEKTNALLKERRQSIIYEAVTKGLNPDAPMKDSGIEWIGQIPSKWNMIRIKHLRNGEENSFEDGDWIEAPYISETGIRYLTTGNIGDGTYKEQGNGFVTQETFDALKCKYAYPGDLVFSRLNAPYGRACILPNLYPEYVLAVDNVILRTDHSKKFLCYLTQCAGYQRMVEEKANGTTMKRISRTNLGDIALPIPTLVEQEAIAKYLETECAATDAVIFANEVTIRKLREYRQSVIYEAVTGKIEI